MEARTMPTTSKVHPGLLLIDGFFVLENAYVFSLCRCTALFLMLLTSSHW